MPAFAATALQQLSSNLDADEPTDDAVWVRDNLDKLTNRWSTRNTDAKSDTARAYQSRAKSALEKYFGWRENPAGFRYERRVAAKRDEPSKKQETVKESIPRAAAPVAADPAVRAPQSYSHRFQNWARQVRCPLISLKTGLRSMNGSGCACTS